MENGGTTLGSCMVKLICGLRGSVRMPPSISRISGTVIANGRRSGPDQLDRIPRCKFIAQRGVARPSGVQSVTIAQTCQSRI